MAAKNHNVYIFLIVNYTAGVAQGDAYLPHQIREYYYFSSILSTEEVLTLHRNGWYYCITAFE